MTQNSKIIIGLTGGIATGKSQVTNYLLDKGFEVIDTDKIAREIVAPGSVGLAKIAEKFGQDLIQENGYLDREKLGEIVFHDQNDLFELNEMLHPLIYGRLMELISASSNKILFLDIPLLFETYEHAMDIGVEYDEIWLIDTLDSLQIQRLMNRDNITEEYARKKINAQWPMDKKRKLANRIILNNTTIKDLKIKVDNEINRIKESF